MDYAKGLNRTNIQTTDLTISPITGCLRGCPYCYARDITNRFRKKYLSNIITILPDPLRPNVAWDALWERRHEDPFYPRLWQERMGVLPIPTRLRSRNGYLEAGRFMVFVCDMGELFGPWVPRIVTANIVSTMCGDNRQQVLQFLTKYPERLPEFNPWPHNAWVGASATRPAEVVAACQELKRVYADVRYLSIEPMLGDQWKDADLVEAMDGVVDWVIIGQMTGRHASEATRIDARQLEPLLQQCETVGAAVFIKPNVDEDALVNLNDPMQRFPWRHS